MPIVEIVLLLVFSHVFQAFCQADCLCGVSSSSGLGSCDSIFQVRIAGGEEAGINEFPWAALLEIKDGGANNYRPLRCGGTLINDRLVFIINTYIFTVLVFVPPWGPWRDFLGHVAILWGNFMRTLGDFWGSFRGLGSLLKGLSCDS